jgi:hypothetical protein
VVGMLPGPAVAAMQGTAREVVADSPGMLPGVAEATRGMASLVLPLQVGPFLDSASPRRA